jgi:Tfp pilus assembly protein PilN
MADQSMKSRKKTALGIDIGVRRISVAVVERSERGCRTIAGATSELPTDASGRPSERAKVLARMLRRLGRRGRRAAVAVSAYPMVMQLLDVPKPMPANLREFVVQEVRQYVALSGKDMLSDYCGIGVAGPQKRLLVVAAEGTHVRETVKACGMAGVAVEFAEPAVLAYARALLRCEGQAGYKADVMIAVLGRHNLVVCLFFRGVLDFVRVREIPHGASSAESLCTWLAEQLQAVMQYCDAQRPRRNGDRQVRLVVHEAPYAPQEIQRGLAVEAGVDSVRVVGPCDRLPDQAVAGQNGSSQTPSAAAFGVAARLLEAEADVGVNLLPAEVMQARRSRRRVLIAANVAAFVFLGMLLTIQYLARATGTMHQELDQTRLFQQLYTMPALIAQEKFLDHEISRIEQQLQQLQVVRGRCAVDWSCVLDTAQRSAPAEVSVTHLACSDGHSLSVKGLASSSEAAQQFVQRLEGEGPFAAVSLARLERQQDRGGPLEYRIFCVLKRTR